MMKDCKTTFKEEKLKTLGVKQKTLQSRESGERGRTF